MKFKMLIVVFVFGIFTLNSMSAAEARVEVQGIKGGKLKKLDIGNYDNSFQINKDKPIATHYVLLKDVSGKWKKMTFSFIPEYNGKAFLKLTARKEGNKLEYDMISVDGGEIKNGSLESLKPEKDAPYWWWWVDQKKSNSGLKENKKEAKDGGIYAEVIYPGRIETIINVKKDQKVTVTLWVKKAK